MRRLLQIFIMVWAIALALISITNTRAAGEDGETPQITLSVYQASPGATIEIAGARFEPDIGVELMLVQNGSETQLGSILADDHGEFLVPVLIPYELATGEYEFRAVDEKMRAATAPLAIVPDAGTQEGESQRQDDDALLAPMPTLAAGAPTPTPAVEIESAKTLGDSNVLIFAGIGIIVMTLLILKFTK